MVEEHSFVQSGTREPNLHDRKGLCLKDNEMATCISDCHPWFKLKISLHITANSSSWDGLVVSVVTAL